MDTGYVGAADPKLLQATASHTAPLNLDNFVSLARQPSSFIGGNVTPLPGLYYEAASRIKYEDIFSSTATHLYEKSVRHPELSPNSPPTSSDLHAPSSVQITSDANMDIRASLSSFNPSDCVIPSLLHPGNISLAQETGIQLYDESEFNGYNLVSPTNFSEFMLHAMEMFESTSGRLPNITLAQKISSLDNTAPSLLKKSIDAATVYSHTPANRQPAVLEASSSMPEFSSSKQDSSILSGEESDGDKKVPNNNKKRNCGLRKAQQKRVVCIPFGDNKQKAEGAAPQSDTWAWRKYGQKPIKGSPYPRGYYRCSSSKGCPARKQVERSRTDPNMVIVTYTADHNHPWPANRPSGSPKSEKSTSEEQSQNREDPSDHIKAENLFSSIINSPKASDEQVVSSIGSMQDEDSFFFDRDVNLCLSRTSTEGDDVFDNLGELPELSAIFSKGYVEERFDDEEFEQPESLC